MHEEHAWSLGREDPLEKKMAICSSILVWEIPRTEEPGQLQSMGSQRVGHSQSYWTTKTNLRYLWHTRPSVRVQGQRLLMLQWHWNRWSCWNFCAIQVNFFMWLTCFKSPQIISHWISYIPTSFSKYIGKSPEIVTETYVYSTIIYAKEYFTNNTVFSFLG